MHPETPDEGQSLEQLFAGRNFNIPAMLKRLKSKADELGLAFGERSMTFNSRRAQELGKWAEAQGKGDEFHMAAFLAYFRDGLNLAHIPVLQEICTGLDYAQLNVTKGKERAKQVMTCLTPEEQRQIVVLTNKMGQRMTDLINAI